MVWPPETFEAPGTCDPAKGLWPTQQVLASWKGLLRGPKIWTDLRVSWKIMEVNWKIMESFPGFSGGLCCNLESNKMLVIFAHMVVLLRCYYENRDNGYACDDGIFYTLNDSCQDGLCTGIPDYCLGCAEPFVFARFGRKLNDFYGIVAGTMCHAYPWTLAWWMVSVTISGHFNLCIYIYVYRIYIYVYQETGNACFVFFFVVRMFVHPTRVCCLYNEATLQQDAAPMISYQMRLHANCLRKSIVAGA